MWEKLVKFIFAGSLSLASLFGGWDFSLYALIVVIIADYISGILSAYYTKTLNSKTGLKGIFKKFAYFCVIALTNVIDGLLNQQGLLRNIIIYYFIATDGLSILENLAEMGIKLPKKLIISLEQLKGEKETEEK